MCRPRLRHYAHGRFRSARVLSTPLCSPPRCHAFHLFIISNSLSRSPPRHHSPPPPHLLRLLPIFSTSSLSSPLRCHIFHVIVVPPSLVFSASSSFHVAGCCPRCHRRFALCVTMLALHFPRRHSLCGTLCRHYISSLLFAVMLVVGCPLCRDRVALIIAGVVG